MTPEQVRLVEDLSTNTSSKIRHAMSDLVRLLEDCDIPKDEIMSAAMAVILYEMFKPIHAMFKEDGLRTLTRAYESFIKVEERRAARLAAKKGV